MKLYLCVHMYVGVYNFVILQGNHTHYPLSHQIENIKAMYVDQIKLLIKMKLLHVC